MNNTSKHMDDVTAEILDELKKAFDMFDVEFEIEEDEEDFDEEVDYQDRFVIEYLELKARYEKLHRILVKYYAGTLDFEPDSPIELLESQAKVMGEYLLILETRAEIENIDLDLED